MSAHVIVCGMGQIGYHVVSLLLRLGQKVSVISLEAREEWSRDAKTRGATYFQGDARDDDLLRQAGIETASAILACTSDDTINIEIALDSQRLNPTIRSIVRIFDLNLATRLQQLFNIEALSTSSVAGSSFASAAFGEDVVSEFRLEDERFLVVKVSAGPEMAGKTIKHVSDQHGLPVLMHLGADGQPQFNPDPAKPLSEGDTIKLVGLASEMKHLREKPRKTSVAHWLYRIFVPLNPLRFVVMVWRDTAAEVRAAYLTVSLVILASILLFGYGLKLAPLDAVYYVLQTVTTVGYGDVTPKHGPTWVLVLSFFLMVTGVVWMVLMYVIVTDYLVSARLDQVSGRKGGPDEGHTIVVGIGDVGLRTAEALAYAEVPVIAVDRNQDSRHLKAVSRRVATLVGDAREPEVLRRAMVQTADAIVVTTNDDATNLSVALAAKAINPSIRSVSRIFDSEFARKVDEAKVLEGAFSAARLTAPTFAGAAMFPGVVCSFVLQEHLIVLSTGEAETATSFKLVVKGEKERLLTVHSCQLQAG